MTPTPFLVKDEFICKETECQATRSSRPPSETCRARSRSRLNRIRSNGQTPSTKWDPSQREGAKGP